MNELSKEEIEERLNQSILLGEKAKRAWDLYLMDYIINKNQEIFEQFANAQSDIEVLSTKQFHNAIVELESAIKSDINSGKIAIQQLNEMRK